MLASTGMTRWLLGFACLTFWACSSTSTNEGSGGVAGVGGTSAGGGKDGGLGGSAGGGGALSCVGGGCVKAILTSGCKATAVSCAPNCTELAGYATCVCQGGSACQYPTDAESQSILECVVAEPGLVQTCLGVQSCIPVGHDCVSNTTAGCCPGLTCDGSVCL